MKQIDKKHYQNAITVQSACNLSGVVISFADAMKEICKEASAQGHGTKWKNEHPICRLYAEQIMHLTSGKDWNEAYNECEEHSSE